MTIIPSNLLVPCAMKRIICHWSEGNYIANSTDLEAYNLLVEGDGSIRGGDHPISDNVSTGDGDYAAHTKGCNTQSIGIAVCAMVGCKESPFSGGSKPMKKLQWEAMVQACAELCHFYKIPVTKTTVLGHGEVQKNLGIQQNGKWDPMVWPWDPSKTREQVGTALREGVAAALAKLQQHGSQPAPPPPPAPAAPATGTYLLRSVLLSADPVMQEIAATNLVLTAPTSSQKVPGIATIQEALNRMALRFPSVPQISFGEGDKYRGFFGPQTEKAIRAFQEAVKIGVDGSVGDDTLQALDRLLIGEPIPVAPITPTAPVVPDAPATLAANYSPPAASADLLKNVPFHLAQAVGQKYLDRFKAADEGSAKTDPSRCKTLLKLPNGVLFFEAKMALCVDGSPRAKELDKTGLTETAHSIGGKPINAEVVSYVVIPRPDKTTGDDFLKDMGLAKGDLAMIIFGGKRCGAILGERGPEEKIGETSIYVHERLHELGAPLKNPWKTSAKKAIHNVSVPSEVLYVIFPGTAKLIASKLTVKNAEALIQKTSEELFTKFIGA